MTVGEGVDLLSEEGQSIQKVTHPLIPAFWLDPGKACRRSSRLVSRATSIGALI
jgi:hypothetical protein